MYHNGLLPLLITCVLRVVVLFRLRSSQSGLSFPYSSVILPLTSLELNFVSIVRGDNRASISDPWAGMTRISMYSPYIFIGTTNCFIHIFQWCFSFLTSWLSISNFNKLPHPMVYSGHIMCDYANKCTTSVLHTILYPFIPKNGINQMLVCHLSRLSTLMFSP